ncbi:Mbov_0400 family ICE element protein [Metamycoplasma auris]|uniref:Uncharacterized protein n=1 Tax=Metamycoplasma auris TaxID=51363 RepID=A0A2W7G8I3_9BACT|nr:hypothetical protein [Metamycoplasma auris]PZV99897.1 hypothetical protein BCF89_10526 [Metamycoplasma auris]
MSKLLVGKVYKQRKKENTFVIAKDKYGNDIIGHGINRPFLIFYSDDKVYYLSTKSISDKNRELTVQDKGNLVLKKDLYGNDKEIAINCSVINVMDRGLFESLYEEDNKLNNYLTSASTYDKVMEKLHDNLNNIQYFEVDSFDSDRTIWKLPSETIKNKDICEEIITTYNEEIKWKYRDLIYKDEDKFYSLVEEEFEEIAKQNKKTNILGDDGGLVL